MIIVRVPNWIGDAVISRGFLKALSDRHGEEVILTGKKKLKAIFYDYEYISFSSYSEYLRILRNLKRKGAEKIFILPPSFSSAFFSFVAGIKERIGFVTDFREYFLTEKIPAYFLKKEHLLRSYLRLIGFENKLKLYYPFMKGFSDEEKYDVLIAPHASYGRAKEWLFFKDLAEFFLKRKFKVTVIGKEKKGDFPEGVIDLRGKTSIEDVLKIISASVYIFSNDSGIAHIGAAMGKKTFVFFGSTSPSWTKPLGKNVYVFYKKTFCSPCFERKCRYNTYECLKKITLDEVIKVFEIVSK